MKHTMVLQWCSSASVAAGCGMVRDGAPPQARQLAPFILSPDGQAIPAGCRSLDGARIPRVTWTRAHAKRLGLTKG